MPEPEPVVGEDEHAARQEDGVGELDDGETAQVLQVYEVACDAEQGERVGEGVYQGEEELEGDYGVDEAGQDAFRYYGVFFDQLREVVETACDGEGQEEEAER